MQIITIPLIVVYGCKTKGGYCVFTILIFCKSYSYQIMALDLYRCIDKTLFPVLICQYYLCPNYNINPYKWD